MQLQPYPARGCVVRSCWKSHTPAALSRLLMSHCSSCSGVQRWVETSRATATRPLTLGFLHRQPQHGVCSVQTSTWPAWRHRLSGVARLLRPPDRARDVTRNLGSQQAASASIACCRTQSTQLLLQVGGWTALRWGRPEQGRMAGSADMMQQRALKPGLGPCSDKNLLCRKVSRDQVCSIPVSAAAWGGRCAMHRAIRFNIQSTAAANEQLHSYALVLAWHGWDCYLACRLVC